METAIKADITKAVSDAVADVSKAHMTANVETELTTMLKPITESIATKAADILIRELMLSTLISQFPDPSTDLGGRLLGLKNLIESEGSRHFTTHNQILEELKAALNLAEMQQNEGSGSGKSESAKRV
jgi:hypothetical protein